MMLFFWSFFSILFFWIQQTEIYLSSDILLQFICQKLISKIEVDDGFYLGCCFIQTAAALEIAKTFLGDDKHLNIPSFRSNH